MINNLPQPRQLFSQEAEQAVIGAALLDSDTVADVEALGLRNEMFFDGANRMIWFTISVMFSERMPVDTVTVFEYMETRGQADNVGGLPYIGDLARVTASTANAVPYAQAVMDYAQEREWLAVGRKIGEVMLNHDGLGHRERVGLVQQLVTGMVSERRSQTQFSLDDGIKQYIEDLDDRYENPGIRGLLTGYQHIDHRLNGLQAGDLMIIAGRPAMGKTTYAMNIALNVAKAKKRVLVFSLEMSTKKLVQRLIAAEGEVQLGLLQSAKVMDHQESIGRMFAGVGRMKGLPMEIDESSSLTISELRARALREHRKAPVDLVVVDYLGLLGSDMKTESPTIRLAEITRGLKVLAGELGGAVIALAQVNRDCEKRTNKRPMLSDLRDSGSLESDTDIVQFVYRDEYYNENTEWKGQLEVITAKQRDGETGPDYLRWLGQYNKVGDDPNRRDAPSDDGDGGFQG